MNDTPSTTDEKAPEASRRRIMKAFGSVMVAAPVMTMLGCGTPNNGSSSSSSSSSSSRASSSSSVASSSSSSSSVSGLDLTPEGWAKGGVASMQVEFPPVNAFAGVTKTNCAKITNVPTLGPCLIGVEGDRQDISEGELGLPLVFAFQLVNGSCNPMPGLKVEVWHTNCDGFYSADENNATYLGPSWNFGNICIANNTTRLAEAKSSMWHRGSQISDGDGKVYFKSCFPGWYSGRVAHLHFKVSENDRELFHTQFAWSDAFAREVHTKHPEYIGRVQDTPLSRPDPEFGRNVNPEWLFDAKLMADGSLQCAKIISVS